METPIARLTTRKQVTWSASKTSAAIKLDGKSRALFLEIPATFTTASVTYKQKDAAGTWKDVYKDGVQLSTTVSAGKMNKLPGDDLFGLDEIQIISNTAETGNGYLMVTA